MTTIFKGKESTKKVDGKEKKVIPFAGTDSHDESMGVGLWYPEEQIGSIWGLVMPHDIITSYRGMKIAEQVQEFTLGTLADCWHAGQRKSHPSDNSRIHEINLMIGSRKRKQILNAPLPSFDEAIGIMQERGIRFDVYPFLSELDQGTLTMTPVLEKVIEDYSDRYLLLHGDLTGDFKQAYESILAVTEKPKGLWERIVGRDLRIDPQHMELARDYVKMVEKILPELIAGSEMQYGLLVQNIRDIHPIISQVDQNPNIKKAKQEIRQNQAQFDRAATRLRGTVANQRISEAEKFVGYHRALEGMVRAASGIAFGMATLGIYASQDELKEEFSATKGIAELTINVINRVARENMPGVYALI